MSVRELPPQVEVVCDDCGEANEYEGITYHYEPSVADERVRESGWRVIDGKHVCAACQEAKGQEVNE